MILLFSFRKPLDISLRFKISGSVGARTLKSQEGLGQADGDMAATASKWVNCAFS